MPPAPALPVMPPTSQQLRQADPNIDIDRQFNHLRGEVNSRIGEWDTWRGAAERTHQSLQNELGAARQRATQLQAQLQELQSTNETLQQQSAIAAQASALQVQNDRLTRLMRYPQLLQQRVVEERTNEAGEAQQVEINPYLDLLMNSTLQGDAFEAAAARVNAGLSAQPPTTQDTPPASGQQATLNALNNLGTVGGGSLPTTFVTPPPGTAQTDDQKLSTLAQQRDEAMDSGDYAQARKLEDQILDLRRKQQAAS
jgi:hypothetical protein